MKPTLIGFDGPIPYAVVVVQREDARRFKQICYDEAELALVHKRFTKEDQYTLDVHILQQSIVIGL